MRTIRLAAGLATAATVLLLAAASGADAPPPRSVAPTPNAPPETLEVELRPVPLPNLEGMDPDVREQLETVRQAVNVMRQEQVSSDELGRAMGELGALYVLYRQYEAAEPALDDATRLDPEEVRWTYLRGFVEQRQGLLDAAAESYRRALELQPEHVPALLRLGEVHVAAGRPDAAADALTRALELSPSCARCRFVLGQAEAAAGRPEEAVEHFRATLELQPRADQVHYPLGQALRAAGEIDAARQELAQVGDTDVAFPDPVLTWARGLATGAGYTSPAAAARWPPATSEPLSPSCVEGSRRTRTARRSAVGWASRCAAPGTSTRRSTPISRRSRSNRPTRSATSRWGSPCSLPAATQRRRSPSSARRSSTRPWPTPSSGSASPSAATARRAKRSPTSIAPLRWTREHRRPPRTGDTANGGRPGQEAIDDLRRTLELDPGRFEARLNLGVLLEMRGDAAAAKRQLEAVLAAAPPPPAAARTHLALGRIAERDGDRSAAIDQYRQATRLAPRTALGPTCAWPVPRRRPVTSSRPQRATARCWRRLPAIARRAWRRRRA